MSIPSSPHNLDYATPASKPPKPQRGVFGWILFIGMAIMFFLLMRQSHSNAVPMTLNRLKDDIESGNVASVNVSDSELTYVTRTAVTVSSAFPSTGPFRVLIPQGMNADWNFLHWLIDTHSNSSAVVSIDSQNNLVVNLLLPLMPWMFILGFVWFFLRRQLKYRTSTPTPVVIVNPEAR